MILIDTSGWGEFVIGDLFDVIKGTRLTKADMKEGNIRFVGSSAMNNGETHRISNNDHLHPKNTITVCYNGSVGESFYQDEEFWASDDVNVLYPKFEMSKYIAWFICPVIKRVGQKYAFVDKWKQEVMQCDIIKLPSTSDGKPDWVFMDSYMKRIMKESEESLENLRRAGSAKRTIGSDEWGIFNVGDLFDIHPTKAYNLTNNMLFSDKGNNPVVVNSGFNNGVGGYTDYECTEKAGIITFTDTAAKSSESFFYQNNDFVGYPHVQGMYPKNHKMTEAQGRFIATVLRASVGKYDFISKMTRTDIAEMNIRLPIKGNGSPDWQYMEDYMKGIIKQAEESLSALKIGA